MHLKHPPNALAAGYKPAGGVAHKVGDAENWASLAAKHGVSPLWLIQYNFETRVPAEINWYLKNRVGCTRATTDGNNLKFSSSDKPGIIYVPSPPMVRSLKSFKFKSFGILIEGDEDYKREVESTLKWIARADTGMVLFKALQRTGKEIEISPWRGNKCNATAAPEDVRGATPKGGTAFGQGKPIFEPGLESLIREWLDLPKEQIVGTGQGSNSIVKFSPSMFGHGASGACGSVAGKPGFSPSQVLFHELAHAYRHTNGTRMARPTVGGSVSYTDMEEFFAIVLSNVLIADPTYSSGNRTLRADHGTTALAPNLSTSKGFVGHTPNANKMRELIASEPQLVKALHGVKSYFNPFTESL